MKRLKQLKIILILCAIAMFSNAAAANWLKSEKIKNIKGYVITASELDKVLVLNDKNEIVRKIEANNTYDAWKLKNGNILYACHRGVRLITPADEIIWNYKSKSEIFACQPLGKNKMLVGECSKGRLIEISSTGEILKEIPLTYKKGGHGCFRGARKIKNGHYLVSHHADKTVREYNKNGDVVKEIVRPFNVYAAQRLSNGSTMISDVYCLSIYDKKGKMVWEFDAREYPELGVNHLTGFQVLPNDEIIICNWLGHSPYKKGIPVFKINMNKEILWKYTNAQQTYSCTNIQVLYE
ncbi:hypothetical protein [Saccharicrinis sp. 156]|uniref:beta-propeller domain-containing protein n=1 Tax=Saccharicrinis sp. 156 TaxID=3417574 RepID=UPI003D333958